MSGISSPLQNSKGSRVEEEEEKKQQNRGRRGRCWWKARPLATARERLLVSRQPPEADSQQFPS